MAKTPMRLAHVSDMALSCLMSDWVKPQMRETGKADPPCQRALQAGVQRCDNRITHFGGGDRRAIIVAHKVWCARALRQNGFNRLFQPRRLSALIKAIAQRHRKAKNARDRVCFALTGNIRR